MYHRRDGSMYLRGDSILFVGCHIIARDICVNLEDYMYYTLETVTMYKMCIVDCEQGIWDMDIYVYVCIVV